MTRAARTEPPPEDSSAVLATISGQPWHAAGDGRRGFAQRPLIDEIPVAMLTNGRPHGVVMATPCDLEDLAVGYTLTERIATRREDIHGVDIVERDGGALADVRVSAAAAPRQRAAVARSSCGMCGVQRLADALRPLAPLVNDLRVSHQAIQRALLEMDAAQQVNLLTRSAHGAAWADAQGRVRLLREDVGRHNALDKLVGAAARQDFALAEGFALITSRCSYEMVEKAVIAGIAILVAISAPTALALRRAQQARLTLIALARHDGHIVYTEAQRVFDLTPAANAAIAST
jgi:FdhD protein